MSDAVKDLSQHVIPAFPPWLDLPPGYIVNDWIAWQKGKLVAERLRQEPAALQHGLKWLMDRRDRLSSHDEEWLSMLLNWSVNEIATLLETPSYEGQRLRSGTPFKGEYFVSNSQMEEIRERAYLG